MTRMLPSTIHSSVQSNAERRLFDRIAIAPNSDDWVCIHSLGLARHGYKRRGEIDFVVVTPEAVLVLEVKGGRVERRQGHWAHTDRYGTTHVKSESPFSQAASAMFALEKDLRAEFGRRSRLGNVLLGFGVLFPDVEFLPVGVEIDRSQVYDLRDAARPFTTWLRRLVEYTRRVQQEPRNGLDKEEVQSLVDYLRGDFELVPSFEVVADDVNQALARLTRQQAACLAAAQNYPRLIVEGPAGTGKSMLAIELARRASAAGQRTLLLCFNRLLAAKLRHLLGDVAPNVVARHAHEFMRETVAKSPLAADFAAACAATPDPRHRYDVLYPEYASVVLADTEQFDYVVVDEAQDLLSTAFMGLLDKALRGGIESGRWRLFLDANEQAAVYGRLDSELLARLRKLAPTNVLSANCRNTTQIALATRAIVRPRSVAVAQHQGEHVERRWYQDSKSLVKELRAVLRELNARRVPHCCVSILYPNMPEGMEGVFRTEGISPLTPDIVPLLGGREGCVITHSTASSFKGLENDVIILVGVENVDEDWWRSVTYVAMSRARVKLYVLVRADLRLVIEARFEELVREAIMEDTR